LDVPECKELAIAKDAVYLRQLLWDSLEIWENKLEDWESQVFHSLDPDEVAATIENNKQIICQLESGLAANQVVTKYKNSISNMNEKVNVCFFHIPIKLLLFDAFFIVATMKNA
jgi:dynein heavy chain